MPMKWDAFPELKMWRWTKSDNTAVVHYNTYTHTYEASIIRAIWDRGMGLNGVGFKSHEDAKAWAALALRED